jgi:hypothetical protein
MAEAIARLIAVTAAALAISARAAHAGAGSGPQREAARTARQ